MYRWEASMCHNIIPAYIRLRIKHIPLLISATPLGYVASAELRRVLMSYYRLVLARILLGNVEDGSWTPPKAEFAPLLRFMWSMSSHFLSSSHLHKTSRAVRTPNMPGPSYTISFSTEAITRLDSTDPGSPSASTSTAQSSSSSGSSSSSTITSGTTSLPGPISSLNVSDIVIQTLSDEMTISLGSGQSSGGNEAGVTAEPSIGASPTNKQSTTAAAIGGTIGGIAFLALLIAVVAFHRRKKQRKALKTNSSELISPKEDQGSWAIPTNMPYMYEKRPRQDIPMVEPSVTSLQDTDAPLDESEVASSISPRSEPSYPAPHPRSTQALIAAAAPPNMSREQIDLLASNFISLVRGRPPGDDITEDGDASDLPPYHREWNS